MFAVRIAGRCSSTTLRGFSTFSIQNSSKTVARFPRKNCNRFYQTETKAWRSWEGTTKAPGITGKLFLYTCMIYLSVRSRTTAYKYAKRLFAFYWDIKYPNKKLTGSYLS